MEEDTPGTNVASPRKGRDNRRKKVLFGKELSCKIL